MISVEKYEGLTARIAILNEEIKRQDVEFYLFVPGELDFSKNVLSEDDFYNTVLSNTRTYFTSQYHLPLVHSRLASRDKLPSDKYRVSLSLYAYQYSLSLEKTTHRFFDSLKDLEEEDAVEQLEVITDMAVEILRRLRRYKPKDDSLIKYFNNIDNYLSWLTEQRFLSLVAHMPRSAAFKPIREQLIKFCESEAAYRLAQNYNSLKAQNDPTRMVNKMRLARRLIEYPVTIRQNDVVLGQTLNKIAKGTATGLVMIFVTIAIIRMRSFLGEITLSFVLAMAGLYALREIFKDDLRDVLWRWIRKGRPKWRKLFTDPTSGQRIGNQLEWLDYIPFDKIPEDVRKVRRGKLRQREESVVRIKMVTQMSTTKFLSGYDMTREVWKVDFRPFSRLMARGKQRFYTLNEGKVTQESIDKRHQFNLISKQKNQDGSMTLQRWKITVNRSKVVDVEEVFG
ncbi:hypothetical protein A1OO_16965 [Enterovibrio norvegicus FF-33]|uniref:hypothetical protein n=1 Tax=Enterovibrio TaxID=188143 RepID=UPI0002F9AD6E|nr:hypothetical protein [Enterovibrio norvegicus]OEE67439.1 hypothetical protein A1OO_16965 [Enterovibrio norvegicus FF-33]OEE86842.1 hypothetical protein A1OQ_00455 [Enterovibrio norvegicus FF-162]